jgi:hypothetical protein
MRTKSLSLTQITMQLTYRLNIEEAYKATDDMILGGDVFIDFTTAN